MKLIVHTTGYWSGWIEVAQPLPLAVNWIRSLKASHRQFVDGAWYVLARYEEGLRTFIKLHDILIPEADPTDPYAILHLRKSAPTAIVKAVWRELVKTLHPDQGGDSTAFIRAKQAYEKIIGNS